MNKKLIIAFVIAIFLVVVGIIAFFIGRNMTQKINVIQEVDRVNDLLQEETINFDQIDVILNRTVAKGNYAEVEDSIKGYLKESVGVIKEMRDEIDDEEITNISTTQNYAKDGPDFPHTKELIKEKIAKFQELKEKYNSLLTEEKTMSYINEKGLSSKYVNFYKNELIGDLKGVNEDQTVQNSLDDMVKLLEKMEEIINFLANNRGKWTIENEVLMFESQSLVNQYNEMINNLNS